MGRKRFKKGRDDDKLVVQIQVDNEFTTYTGRYEELEFEGDTVGDEYDVRMVLTRMLTAEKEIPDRLMSVLTLVVGYIELMVNAGVQYVSTNAGISFLSDCEVGIKVSLAYEDSGGDNEENHEYVGWVAKLRASFYGYDGYTHEARHEVKKELRFGDKLDIDILRTELVSLAKMAYNAHKSGWWRKPCV